MIPRLINWQGMAGIGIGLALAILLVIQKGETGHWKKESANFERLYREEQAAFATTVANYRAAADQARAADQANAARVAADQRNINERTEHDFEARIAAARAELERLRGVTRAAPDPGAGRGASVPRLPTAADGTAEAAGKDGFPQSDALTATEQAIQLDELIKWVRQQHAVAPSPPR